MYTIEIAKSTACIMLKDQEGKLVDYQFINKYHYENFMTLDELENEIHEIAVKNSITEYVISGGLV
jgi:hypothetical protein